MEIFKYKNKINKIPEEKNKGSLGFFILHRVDDGKVILAGAVGLPGMCEFKY